MAWRCYRSRFNQCLDHRLVTFPLKVQMSPEPSQTIHQRAWTVTVPKNLILSQALLQMEGNKTSSRSTMRIAYTTEREVTCNLRVFSGDLKSEHCLHGVHGPLLVHLSNEASSSASCLSTTHKCKEDTTSEMHKASKHTLTCNHPSPQGWPPSPLTYQENPLHVGNSATSAS